MGEVLFSDVWVDLKWLLWCQDTWSCTFLLPFLTSTTSLCGSHLGKVSSAGWIFGKQMQKLRVSNHLGDLALLQPSSSSRFMKGGLKTGDWKEPFTFICWALASASLITADKVPMCSYSESTVVMSASVKDLSPYRERSHFSARKHLVPGMNPHTDNATTK